MKTNYLFTFKLGIKKRNCLTICFTILSVYCLISQEKLPSDWKSKTKIKYESLKEKEVSFEVFESFEKSEYFRLNALKKDKKLAYKPQVSKSICGNGDFESSTLIPDPTEWTGGYGTIGSILSGGLLNGNINLNTSHHTIVPNVSEPSLTDPVTGIINVKHSGSRALRLGNRINGYGTELVSKTFLVTNQNSIISFWYALVQESFHNSATVSPKFTVKVLSYPGSIEVPNLVDLGNGSNSIFADNNNPFFATTTYNSNPIVYKDWSCAQINLTSLVGQNVTIEFINQDCSAGGHFGYVYLDDFCGLCKGDPQGWIGYNANTTNCKEGKICFDYGLPTNGNSTGTCQITLEIIQNGITVTTLTSPVLSSGNNYCFNFDCNDPKLNLTLGGFDFVATAAFNLGSTILSSKIAGSKPMGQLAGLNNDCKCKIIDGLYCCDSISNMVKNPTFESGNIGFTSQYTFQNSTSPNSILPGQYSVLSNGLPICSNWKFKDHTGCIKPGNSNVLVINGETTQATNVSNVVWEQNITGLEIGKDYKFCAYMKNLSACCFDVKPKVKIEATPGGSSGWITVNAGPNDCDWQLVSFSFSAASTTVNLKIYLDEITKGDGNDLAIDDISLHKLGNASVQISVTNNSISSGCQITASINGINNSDDGIMPGKNCKYFWIIGKLSTISPPVFSSWPQFGGSIGNPSWGLTTNFPGFICQPGQPYLIYLYIYDCDCLASGYSYQVSMDGRIKKLSKADEEILNQEVKKYLIQEQKKE